jgi:hypothetical protein
MAAGLEGNWLQAEELYTRALNSGQPGTAYLPDLRMASLIALHQPSKLSRRIQDEVLRSAGRPGSARRPLALQAEAAASLDQWSQALAALEAFEAEVAPTLDLRARADRMTFLWPQLAYARARNGDLAGAQTLIAATPLDCYLCVRERARIAELAGDRAAADRWSTEARRQGPSLPFAFAERGQMLMARGDIAGAIAVALVLTMAFTQLLQRSIARPINALAGMEPGAVAEFIEKIKIVLHLGEHHTTYELPEALADIRTALAAMKGGAK